MKSFKIWLLNVGMHEIIIMELERGERSTRKHEQIVCFQFASVFIPFLRATLDTLNIYFV